MPKPDDKEQSNTSDQRWSLLVTAESEEVAYAMHCNSPVRMAWFFISHLAKGRAPKKPWCLHFVFNPTGAKLFPSPRDVTADGNYLTPSFIHRLEAIDPHWREEHTGLVVIDAKTGEPLDEPYEVSFGKIMFDVFAMPAPIKTN